MWEYKREESSYPEIPEGSYRVRINSCEKAVSKSSGNEMLVIKLDVSGYSSWIWNYITFMPNNPQLTNRLLTQFFDSFGIEDTNFNLASYVGKVGAAKIKHDENGKAKVSYFIDKKKQDSLPAWKEVAKGGTTSAPKTEAPVAGFEQTEDIPF